MIPYRKTQPSISEPEFARDIILQTLLPLGFEIVCDSSHALTLAGPGYRSTRQNPLLGISRASFELGRSSISIDAELGGLNRMTKLLLIILVGVGLFDSATFFGLWYFLPALNEHKWFLFIPA